MEKQLEFPFIAEGNMLEGKTCVNCKHQQRCVDQGEVITEEHTCGDWEFDTQRAQEDDSDDAMRDFYVLMDKYSIGTEDARRIYLSANMF